MVRPAGGRRPPPGRRWAGRGPGAVSGSAPAWRRSRTQKDSPPRGERVGPYPPGTGTKSDTSQGTVTCLAVVRPLVLIVVGHSVGVEVLDLLIQPLEQPGTVEHHVLDGPLPA